MWRKWTFNANIASKITITMRKKKKKGEISQSEIKSLAKKGEI